MKTRSTQLFNLFVVLSMALSMLATPTLAAPVAAEVSSAPAAQEDPNAKLTPALVEKFAEGSADYIVHFKEQADLSAAYEMDWEARGAYVYNTLKETAERSQAGAKALLDGAGLRYQTFIAGNELYVWSGDMKSAQSLAVLPEVEYIRETRLYQIDPWKEESSPLKSYDVPNATPVTKAVDSPSALAWGIVDTQADQFWSAFGFQGDGILVANIDTGVQWDHPALVNQFKCNPNPSDPSCWADPSNICGGSACDNVGHGTHTMGTMVADDDPALLWQAGMAPNSQWIACKGCESNWCSDFALNTCADWILAPGGNPNNRPNIVNNSWGGGGGNPWYQPKVQSWQAAGIFPAFSAGNSGPSCGSLGSPGDYQESFGSAAHDSGRAIAWFSSRGPSAFGDDPYTKPNISAPGVNVCSTVPGNGWDCSYSGTSMASPHTAGAVALLWSCNPSLVGEIDLTFQILQDNADPAPAGNCGAPADGEGNYTYGYGYLNVLNAGNLWCGGTGFLNGNVEDAYTGFPIQSARITALHQDGFSRNVLTDASGYYTMTVAAGIYQVTASHPRYVSATVSGVEVITDTVTTQNFELTPRGRLFGYVTDYDNGFPLQGATVTADDGTTATTNASGFYEMWLDPGTYEVTASAQDYAPETFTVDIFSGEDTRQDFSLMAAVVFIPTPLEKTLDYGETVTQVVTLLNRLPDPYNFEFKEGRAGFTPVLAAGREAGGRGEWLYRAATGVPMKNNKGEDVLAYPSAYRWTADSPSQVSVLIYADDYYHPAPNTFLDRALQALGMSYTAHYNGDFFGFINDLQSGTWDMVLVGNDNYADTSIFGPLNNYVLNGGKLVIHTWTMSWDTFNPLWSNLGVAWMTDDWDPPDPVYWWDPSHSLFNDPESVPEFTQLQPYRYGTYGQRVAWSGDFEALAGYTTPGPDPNQAALVLGNDGRTIFKGFLDGQNDADLDSDGVYDGAELWINIISGLESGFGVGVPWFGQDPLSGTIPAESSINATMFFTATAEAGVEQPGVYNLTLTVDGEPGTPDVRVPVYMNVIPPATWGKLEGTVIGLGYCDANPAPLKKAEVLIEGSGGMSWVVETDANGHFQWWLDEAYSPLTVTVSYPEHETGEATGVIVVGQQTTTVDFDLRWLVPCVSTDPTELSASLDMGDSTTLQVTLANTGAAGTPFEIREKDAGFVPAVKGAVAKPPSLVSKEQANAKTALGLDLPAMPKAAPLNAGDVLQTWSPFENDYAWGIAYDGDNETVWVGDGWTYENTIFEYLPDGTATGRSHQYTWGPYYGPADSAFNWNTGTLWTLDVGLDDCIHEMDPAGGYTGNMICGPWTISQRGVAYDPEMDTWFVGGWNEYTIYHIDSAGNLLDSAYVGLSISGLAYNPETRHLFVMVNSWDEPVYVLDVANNYQIIGQFYISGWQGGGNGAGLEIDCEGNLWAVAQYEQRVYEVDSGETANLCTTDVPWLSEDPVSGYLDPDTGQQVVDVTFDAGVSGVDQPGEYRAFLKVKTDDPLNGNLQLPVTMTVIPPETWGKLTGVISSLGYCDENPFPIAKAQIVIESSAGVTYTLQSGDDGSYIRWLDEAGSPYTVYVTAADHIPSEPVTVEITGQQTTTQDIFLRWMVPCLSVAPESYSVEIPQGFTIDYPFTLINIGAGMGEFKLRDKVGQEPAIAASVRGVGSPAADAPNSAEVGAFVRIPSTPSRMADADVLLIQDWDAWGYPAITSILMANGIAYDLINSGQIAAWDFSPYKMIIIPSVQSQNYYNQFNNNLAKFEDYIDSGGLLLMSFCTQGEIVSIPFGGSNNWDGQEYNYIVDPTHPIFAGVSNPYWGSYASHNSLSTLLPDDVVLVTTGMSPGGNPVMIERKHGAGMLVAGGQTFEYGWGNGQAAGIILTNMIPYYYYNWEAEADAPWLAQDPTQGVVDADSSYEVNLLFTAFPTMPVGSFYTATLVVKTNDMVNTTVNVPVTMTVIAAVTALDIDAPVTQLIGEQSTIVTHVITVTNQSNHPDAYDLVLEGYWWATWAPASVGRLLPGESATVEIRVGIPPTVFPGASDTVLVKAISRANSEVFDSIALTTTAARHVATLTPEVMTLMGIPGHTVTYNLVLENTGNIADTFVVTYTHNTWDVQIVGDASMDLEPGESHEVTIQVTVPEDAADGDWDMVVIEVYGKPGQVAAAQLTTVAAFPKVYLPSIPQGYNTP